MDPHDSPKSSSNRILVTGATGYIGGRLVTRLVEEGHFVVRAMARDRKRLDRRRDQWPEVEIVEGDVFRPESLVEAMRGVDTAFYLVHSMSSQRDYNSRDRLAAQNFARAAERAGVRRIIYLGGLPGTGRSAHLASRMKTGNSLRSGKVPVTELRAAIIVGSGSASFEIIRDLVMKLPVMVAPRWVRSRCEPVAIRQVLAYLVGCLEEPRTIGETLEIGGGEVLTYKRMLEIAAEVFGRRVWIFTVPVLTPQLSSYWLNLVTRVPFNVAKPLVESLREDVVTSDQRIRDWITVPSLTYRQAVELAKKREEEGTRETRWTDAANAFFRVVKPDQARRYYRDERVVGTNASPEAIFAIVRRIGGKTGWYYGNWLWQLRGLLDWLVGGFGMRRGRSHPDDIHVGDTIDFWRVRDYVAGRRLVLDAEMKLPGIARLEFYAIPRDDEGGCFFIQRARFWPTSLLGDIYWFAVLPFHFFIFEGMAANIVRHAEGLEGGAKSPRRPIPPAKASRSVPK